MSANIIDKQVEAADEIERLSNQMYCDDCMAQIDNCICKGPDIIDKQVEDEPVRPIDWLEYEFFVALHNLADVAPDHYLVTTIKAALESRPAHLKRQAE